VYLFSGLLYIKSGYKIQIVSIVLLLAGYYWLITQVPVPGLGHASLQPETNLGAWLDRTVFGTAHLWSESKTWDPEGLLGTLPAIATTLIGIVTGTWLKRKESSNLVKVGALLAAGAVLVAAGLLWNKSFPINKALWTSSYVLFTGGLAMVCLTLFYWLIDIQGYRWFTKPFVVYGANAILVYVVSELMARTLNRVIINYQGEETSLSAALYHTFFEPYFSPYHASLGWAIGFVLAWMVLLWALYNKRIFIKI
jgi:predicted acyltransferase